MLWGVSQVVLAIFGEHLKSTLGITNTITAQGLLALSGIGMILGSIFAGRVSKNYIETGTGDSWLLIVFIQDTPSPPSC